MGSKMICDENECFHIQSLCPKVSCFHTSDVQESVCHLNVKDIKSSDSEVLVPSSNAAIGGQSNIPYNASDTTFEESVTNSKSLEKSVDANKSDQFGITSIEVKDTVVESGIVNEISGKNDGVSSETNIVSNENLEWTGEDISLINPDVTQTQSTREVSANSMSTDKSSYKESDGATSESCETNISLQYLTDEGKANNISKI